MTDKLSNLEERIREVAESIDFGIDITEPKDVRVRRIRQQIETAFDVWPEDEPTAALTIIRGEDVKFAFIEAFQAARKDTCGDEASEDLIDHFWDESVSRKRLAQDITK